MLLSPVDFSHTTVCSPTWEFVLMRSAHYFPRRDPRLHEELREVCRQAHPTCGKGVLDAKPKAKGHPISTWDPLGLTPTLTCSGQRCPFSPDPTGIHSQSAVSTPGTVCFLTVFPIFFLLLLLFFSSSLLPPPNQVPPSP